MRPLSSGEGTLQPGACGMNWWWTSGYVAGFVVGFGYRWLFWPSKSRHQ